MWYSIQSWCNGISKEFKLDFTVTFIESSDQFFVCLFAVHRLLYGNDVTRFLQFPSRIYQLKEISQKIHHHLEYATERLGDKKKKKNILNDIHTKKFQFIAEYMGSE